MPCVQARTAAKGETQGFSLIIQISCVISSAADIRIIIGDIRACGPIDAEGASDARAKVFACFSGTHM